MSAGTYVVTCDLCRGAGVVRFGLRPMESCHKCDGAGVLTIIDPEREEKLASWRAGMAFIAVVCIAVAAYCLLLILASNRWHL